MKDRPILAARWSRPSLEGKKTQRWRPIRIQPPLQHLGYQVEVDGPGTVRIVGPDYPDMSSMPSAAPSASQGTGCGVKRHGVSSHSLRVSRSSLHTRTELCWKKTGCQTAFQYEEQYQRLAMHSTDDLITSD